MNWFLFSRSHGAHGLTIHFNVHMDPARGETEADELLGVIRHEIDVAANTTESILGDLVIDGDSLEIQGMFCSQDRIVIEYLDPISSTSQE